MAQLTPREEIISLLRGFFACPLISIAGRKDILDKMTQDTFKVEDFSDIPNKKVLNAIFRYFTDLGLIAASSHSPTETFSPTELGLKVFSRFGSFCLIHSYGEYMRNMESLLMDPEHQNGTHVDRLENIIGSGHTHSRKFFPFALDVLKNEEMTAIIDIGCGDGEFVKQTLKVAPQLEVVTIDLSQVALDRAQETLHQEFPKVKVNAVLSDGMDVANWSNAFQNLKSSGTKMISMWFLIHEISQGQPERIIQFFKEIHRRCPNAEIIIGEIVNLPSETLAGVRHESAMPEFLLFHDLSNQHVLTWQDFQHCLAEIPYELKKEKHIDPVTGPDGIDVPSAFVWHLTACS